MKPRLDVHGLGLDEDFSGQRGYAVTLRCPHELDEQDRFELEQLVQAWYIVGFHGGFGGGLNRLRDMEYGTEDGGVNATFGVAGTLTTHALDDLLRCFTDSDMDIVVESVIVDVSEVE